MVMKVSAPRSNPPAFVYQKVFDSRKHRVRGLWQCTGKFFAHLTFAADLIRKSSRWVPPVGASFTAAKGRL